MTITEYHIELYKRVGGGSPPTYRNSGRENP